MKYAKPEITLVNSAAMSILSGQTVKQNSTRSDSFPPNLQTIPAYEGDE